MSYSSEVLADSPLGYWRMGDASGTTMTDSSPNGRHGSYINSPTLGTAGLLVGDSDTAITVNNVGTSSPYGLVADDNSLDNLSAFTVEAFVKPSSTSGTPMIAARDDTTTAGRSFQFYISGGKLAFTKIANGVATATGATTLAAGTTYHVAATYDGATLRVYVNGTQDGTAATSGTLGASTTDLRIGARRNTSPITTDFFSGVIDEVAVYNTSLSPTRIAAHYTAGTTVATTGTLSGVLPALSASLSGGVTFSGTVSAVLPALGADLAGTSLPPGIAGDLTATLPPLGGSLVGAYSDTATLTAILPPLSAAFAGTAGPPPVTGTLAGTLPALRSTITGQAFEPGVGGFLEALLPALSAALSGTAQGRNGLGLVLDSSAVLTVDPVLEPEPTVPPGTPPTVLHIIAPTVPAPTLVAGRPL